MSSEYFTGANNPRLSIRDSGRDEHRTLNPLDRQKIYARDKGKCQVCGKDLELFEIQIGHKKAWPSDEKTIVQNSVVLCYKHYRVQGNLSLLELKEKLGFSGEKEKKKKKR
ncbi:HNH endonuclease [Candidatus Micrarchaeota archaeon]|nr:HNH endonuclease [Candidatus Micrarchaeota archaeon]